MTGPQDEHDPHGEHHDELRARLRRADPASSLPASSGEEVSRLTRTAASRRATQPGRLIGAAAAAAVVVVAGASWAIGDHGSGSGTPFVAAPGAPATSTAAGGPSSGRTKASPLSQAGTTRLTLAAQPGRCAVPTGQTLAAQSLVVVATVTSVADGTAQLTVQHVYRGTAGSTVTVTTPAADGGLTPSVDFVTGHRYLVSATDGVVAGCGLSGPLDGAQSGPVTALVEDAFGG